MPPSRQATAATETTTRRTATSRRMRMKNEPTSTVGGTPGFVNRFRRSRRIGCHRIDFCSRLSRPIGSRHPCDRPIVSPLDSGALFVSLSSQRDPFSLSRFAALSSVHRASFSFHSLRLGIPHLWRTKIYACRQLRRLRQEIECDIELGYHTNVSRTRSTPADHSEIFEYLAVRGL